MTPKPDVDSRALTSINGLHFFWFDIAEFSPSYPGASMPHLGYNLLLPKVISKNRDAVRFRGTDPRRNRIKDVLVGRISDLSEEIVAGYYRYFFEYWKVHYHSLLHFNFLFIINNLAIDNDSTYIASWTKEVREINDNFGYFT